MPARTFRDPRRPGLDPSGRVPAHQLGQIIVGGNPVQLLDLGAWVDPDPITGNARFYGPGSLVTDSGIQYLCIAPNGTPQSATAHEPPDATYWQVFDPSQYFLRQDRIWSPPTITSTPTPWAPVLKAATTDPTVGTYVTTGFYIVQEGILFASLKVFWTTGPGVGSGLYHVDTPLSFTGAEASMPLGWGIMGQTAGGQLYQVQAVPYRAGFSGPFTGIAFWVFEPGTPGSIVIASDTQPFGSWASGDEIFNGQFFAIL